MSSIMFLGTSSGAGKTVLGAVYCRHLAKRGRKAAPFKASNLSLNSYVTEDGGEIGMGQALQAWACGIEPARDMNPILMKPSGNGRMQIVLGGEPLTEIGQGGDFDRAAAMEKATRSYDRLAQGYDFVVCEGSGSPAELNLQDKDLANIGMIRARGIPCVLVADIERGGAFAAIYGTWLLIPEDVRHLVRAFIINRFRGDASILGPGIGTVEGLTGMKCAGIVPYETLRFPEEDSMGSGNGTIGDGDIREESVKNLDAMLEDAEGAGVDFSVLDDLATWNDSDRFGARHPRR